MHYTKSARPLDQLNQAWAQTSCNLCKRRLRAISETHGTSDQKREWRTQVAQSHYTEAHRAETCSKCALPFTQTGVLRTNPSSKLCFLCLLGPSERTKDANPD